MSPSRTQLAALLIVFSARAVIAQTTATEDPLVLSPFTVAESEDRGYQATSTLAGTRLNTELRNVGSAISVMTAEFFQDTGATNMQTALSYGLNTEVGGVQGNFANPSFENFRADQDSQRLEPQNGQRVRGLASASLTRNYFLTDIPFDSYNTSRVTINRGPNSLLFGIGSPGGIIENSTNRALLNRDLAEASLRFGDHGSHREAVDISRRLIDRRLGFRVSMVNDRKNYEQKPAYEHDRRIYGAAEGVLFENRNSRILDRTVVHANFEQGFIVGSPPNVLPPNDSLTHWFEAPDASVERFTGSAFTTPAWLAQGRFRPKFVMDNRIPALLGREETGGGFDRVTQVPYFIQHVIRYADPSGPATFGIPGSPLQGGQPRIPYTQAAEGRGTWDEFVTTNYLGMAPGFTTPVIMDPNIYDNRKWLMSGNTSWNDREFDTQTITIEQVLLKGKAGVEVSYDHQDYYRNSSLNFASGRAGGNSNDYDVVVDVNRFLPTGEANPNLGRPMMKETNFGDYNEFWSTREAYRATAFYELDLESRSGIRRWLGRHIFTGFGNRQHIDLKSKNIQKKLDGLDFDLTRAMNQRYNTFNRNVLGAVYLGPSMLGPEFQSVSDVRLQNVNVPVPKAGDQFTMYHFDLPSRTLRTSDFVVREILNAGNISRQSIDSTALSWQSFFFGGNLVGLYGWREDRTKSFERLSNERLPDGSWDPANLKLSPEPTYQSSGQSITWSVVGHLPRDLVRLPWGSSLSAHYNESENFQPVGVRRNVLGATLESPKAETREHGFTVELFERRLNFRFNWFKTASANVTSNTGLALNDSTRWIGDWLGGWKTAENSGMTIQDAMAWAGAPGLYNSYDQVYREIINFAPPEVQSVYNWRMVDNWWDWDPVESRVATTSYVARGFEVDVVGSITPNWRVMFNVGKQETVQSNTAPVLARVASGIYDRILASPLGRLGDQPHTAAPSTFTSRYQNQVMNTVRAALVRDGTVSLEQRKWRANFVSNYTFAKDSRLRGFGVGGGVRWQDKAAIGYPLLVEDTIQVPDLSRPYFGDEELSGDVWASYERRLRNGIRWKIQLNVRNAYGERDYVPVLVNPDGQLAVVRNPNPVDVYLTNTISF
jgi:outer membrane receptor protein involved in Fe transport